MRRFLLMITLLLWPAASFAEVPACAINGPIAAPVADREAATAERRVVPITGYTLALTWAPEYCRTRTSSARDALECGHGRGRGFVLHGLWPEGRGDQWPQYCRPVSLLPVALIRRNICALPSAQLQQHEWEKHGSCTGSDLVRYFADATRAFSGIRYPDMEAASRHESTAGALSRAIAAANPGMPPDAVRVVPNRRGWLTEVRICLDKAARPIACPASREARFSGSQAIEIWRGGTNRPSRSPDGAYRGSGG